MSTRDKEGTRDLIEIEADAVVEAGQT